MKLNFTMSELIYSDTAKKYNIYNMPDTQQLDCLLNLIVYCLQPIRDYIGKPMKISSGFRSVRLNNHPTIKGSNTSQHIKGQAADFTISGMTPKQIIEKIVASGIEFDQLINEYNIWVHVSYNKGNNRKQVLYIQ